MRSRLRHALLSGLALSLTGCTAWLFSSTPRPSREYPVVRVETRQGAELGIGTDFGILLLGRTATAGPCRVHFWLGPTPVVDDGRIEAFGGVFYRAAIDLRFPWASFLDRELRAEDELVALVAEIGRVDSVPLTRVDNAEVQGDVVAWPGRDLPIGTGVFVRADDQWRAVGMIGGQIEVGGQRYYVHTGTTAWRDALLTARAHPKPREVKHRADDITVDR
jgi:hypothetical protein